MKKNRFYILPLVALTLTGCAKNINIDEFPPLNSIAKDAIFSRISFSQEVKSNDPSVESTMTSINVNSYTNINKIVIKVVDANNISTNQEIYTYFIENENGMVGNMLTNENGVKTRTEYSTAFELAAFNLMLQTMVNLPFTGYALGMQSYTSFIANYKNYTEEEKANVKLSKNGNKYTFKETQIEDGVSRVGEQVSTVKNGVLENFTIKVEEKEGDFKTTRVIKGAITFVKELPTLGNSKLPNPNSYTLK